jgi:hypothetical protein
MSSIKVAISTIADGSMLNRHHGSDPVIIANRERFLQKNGIDAEQTTRLKLALHDRLNDGETDFCRYSEVSSTDKGAGMHDTNVIISDAIVTREPNHALFLPIADCVATAIYDPVRHVLMLSHLGRHSLEQQGAVKSVQYLVDHYGSSPADLLVWSSPAPNKEVYPIWKLDNQGMKEAWFEQMASAGILPEHITDNPADSATDLNYYSYSEFLKGHRSEDGDYGMVAMMTD